MTVFSFARKIGDALYREWGEINFDVISFPSLAYNSITSSKPETEINVFDIPFSLLRVNQIPKQRVNNGSLFGQPPLTLYVAEDKRFFIEIYLWSSVDMTIHDHPFSGAFTVLEGVCQHDSYLFERSGGSNQLQMGSLIFKETELMSKGDCRMIFNGDRLIHRNLHLSKPTVTFIIRTYRDLGLTGRIYEESGLAIAPDLTIAEQKFLDYLDGVLRLNNYDTALRMIQSLISSGFSDFAKYHSAKVYLEQTRRYNEVESISDMLASSIPDVTSDFFRKTFLLQIEPILSGESYTTY
ncbi:hypothetical protein [Fastidiosibacter lacustris]|uniref:hypothetical protein n=1 Tax=Fastidiosibacter lacustris TaxID=2056695 RepID=UPI000E34FE8A|nr:hypothetical protein [Fastidiosibacter lacustris]